MEPVKVTLWVGGVAVEAEVVSIRRRGAKPKPGPKGTVRKVVVTDGVTVSERVRKVAS